MNEKLIKSHFGIIINELRELTKSELKINQELIMNESRVNYEL